MKWEVVDEVGVDEMESSRSWHAIKVQTSNCSVRFIICCTAL